LAGIGIHGEEGGLSEDFSAIREIGRSNHFCGLFLVLCGLCDDVILSLRRCDEVRQKLLLVILAAAYWGCL